MATRSKDPASYADALGAVNEAKAAANRARLRDEGEHFPYKREEALAALRTPPEEGTNNHPAHWYTSEEIIEASAAYVAAQEAYLRDTADAETRNAYDRAKEDLAEARRRHRRGRPIAPVAVAGAPQEIEQRRSMMRALGRAGYDAGTIAAQTGRPVAEVQGALAGSED